MAKKTSAAKKAAYGRYKSDNVASKNKQARLAKHAVAHPNDEQSQKKAKPLSTRFGYKGPTKKAKKLSSVDRLRAQLVKIARPAIAQVERQFQKSGVVTAA